MLPIKPSARHVRLFDSQELSDGVVPDLACELRKKNH